MSSGSETAVLQDSRSGPEKKGRTWSSAQTSISTTEGESDAELHAFIKMRNKVDKDTEVKNKYTCSLSERQARTTKTNTELRK